MFCLVVCRMDLQSLRELTLAEYQAIQVALRCHSHLRAYPSIDWYYIMEKFAENWADQLVMDPSKLMEKRTFRKY